MYGPSYVLTDEGVLTALGIIHAHQYLFQWVLHCGNNFYGFLAHPNEVRAVNEILLVPWASYGWAGMLITGQPDVRKDISKCN